jgi:hypothetical protein
MTGEHHDWNGGLGWTTKKEDRPQCRARTRTGGECKARVVWDSWKNRPRNGKCRMHGGVSTGPTSRDGKIKSLSRLTTFQGWTLDRIADYVDRKMSESSS